MRRKAKTAVTNVKHAGWTYTPAFGKRPSKDVLHYPKSELARKYNAETPEETGDPRVLGYGHVWEDYPRLRGPMRYFPKED